MVCHRLSQSPTVPEGMTRIEMGWVFCFVDCADGIMNLFVEGSGNVKLNESSKRVY